MEDAQLIFPQIYTPPSIVRLEEDDIGLIRPKKKGLNQKIIDDDDE
jgi:hypothetical protein